MNSKALKRPNNTQPNRSVYAIVAPCRDWFLHADPPDQHHKNQLVLYRPGLAAKAAGQKSLRGAGRPGSRRGLPLGVMVFAGTKHNCKKDHNSSKNPCHREAAATAPYRPNVVLNAKTHLIKII